MQNREYIEKQDSMEILYSAKLGYVVLFVNHFDRPKKNSERISPCGMTGTSKQNMV